MRKRWKRRGAENGENGRVKVPYFSPFSAPLRFKESEPVPARSRCAGRTFHGFGEYLPQHRPELPQGHHFHNMCRQLLLRPVHFRSLTCYEIPDKLARKICQGLSVPQVG